ncbi:hypothetical protein EJB05_01255, partial [Eragrostis curvula]
MDLFTAKSDLDLSISFNNNINNQFPRKDKISAIRKLAEVLHDHQNCEIVARLSNKIDTEKASGANKKLSLLWCSILPIVTAIVPVLKVTDQEIGVECDISVENKDGMSRSTIFKFISSIDKRLQSLADCSDFTNIGRNVSLFEGFGSRNKESIAEIFLVLVEGLWEQGLCASNFEGSWISKTWARGVGNSSFEDFMDRSQNFARSVRRKGMQKICECLSPFCLDPFWVKLLKASVPMQIRRAARKGLRERPLITISQSLFVIEKDAKNKKLDNNSTGENSKPVTPTIQKDARKKISLRPPASSSRPPTGFIPP